MHDVWLLSKQKNSRIALDAFCRPYLESINVTRIINVPYAGN